jgi:WD40 repeat protein/class 3 adenylate cyclase
VVDFAGGTLTFLFSDIEGSTRLLRRLRDRYAAVLADHRTLMRAAFVEYGGEEMGTEGDAFFVAFRRARDAVGAAAAAQRALAAHEWPDGQELRVRMGLNTGEPGLEEEGYFGLGLHLTARICSAAHGGQVLVSQSTCAVTQDEDLGGLELRDLGEHFLKDFDRPERLFQLVIDGLPAEFPPPKTLDTQTAADAAFRGEVGLPYKGLEAFQPQDAEFFFGREDLGADLARRLAGSAFLAVVGPSGSGKSSVVRAGLVPAIWAGAHGLGQSRDWKVVILTPGTHPLEELAVRLAAEQGLSPGSVLEDLRRDPHNLCLAVRQLLLEQPADARVVLIVDQAEEVFTLCRDEEERRLFLELLAHAAGESAQTIVVLALRADFYGHCATYPALAALLQDHHALVGPMREAEIRRAIERPAAKAGVELEQGLVDRILDDVGGEPGSLPLLSHALLETWSRRQGQTMTLAAYLDSGGVRGAIARTADTVYGGLEPPQQEVARGIFLRLTEPGQGTEDTRRRASLSELLPGGDEQAAVEEVLDILARARLVTVGLDSVEVAHEALIREWPLLRRWLDEDREGLLIHRRLTDDSRDWIRYERDPGLLYRGGRLSAAQEWADANEARLSDEERAFLETSSAALEREAQARRRRQLILKGIAATLAVLLGLTAAAAIVAANQRSRAQREERSATARSLIQAAEAQLPQRLDLSLLLGLEAERTRATPEGRSVLLRAAQRAGRIRRILRGHEGRVFDVGFSRDGKLLASTGEDGSIRLWDGAGYRSLGQPLDLPGSDVAGNAVALGAGGLLAAGGSDGIVRLWNLDGRRRLAEFPAPAVGDLDFSPDGRLLAAATETGALVWQVSERRRLAAGAPAAGNPATRVAFSPDGRTLAVAGINDVTLMNVRTGARTPLTGRAVIEAVAFSPDGGQLAVAREGEPVELWDVRAPRSSPRRLSTLRSMSVLAFDPSGKRLAAAGGGGTIVLVDPASGRQLPVPLVGHTASVEALAFAGDGRALASAGDDGTVIVWDAAVDPRATELTRRQEPAAALAASTDGAVVAAAYPSRTVVWRLRGRPAQVREIREDGIVRVALSGDGRTLAAGTQTGEVLLARVAGGPVRRLSPADPSVQEPVVGVALNEGGTMLAASLRNGEVLLGGTSKLGRPLPSVDRQPPLALAVALSSDGRTLAAGRQDGTIAAWDTAGRKPIGKAFRAHRQEVRSVAFTPDGATLLSAATGDTAVKLWDVRTGAQSGEPLQAPGAANAVNVSPDGGLAAAGTGTGSAVLFDLVSRLPLGSSLAGHSGAVHAVAFAGNERLASAGADGRVLLWNVGLWADEDVLRDRACSLVGRNLSRSEWDRFLPGRSYRRTCDQWPAGE